jgi:hypothetical protein
VGSEPEVPNDGTRRRTAPSFEVWAMSNTDPDDVRNTELGEAYLALARIVDDYQAGVISYQEANERVRVVSTTHQPDWWQKQVIMLSLIKEHQRRAIRRLLVTMGFLVLVIVVLTVYIVLFSLH